MGFSSDVLIAHGLSPMYDAELRYIYIGLDLEPLQ